MTIDGNDTLPAHGSNLSQQARQIAANDPNRGHIVEKRSAEELAEELRLYKIELELRQAEEQRFKRELQQTREHYANLFHNAPVGYVALDHDGSIEEINLRASQILGRERREIIGCLLQEVLTPRSRELLNTHIRDVLNNDEVQRCELVVTLPDGGRRDIEIRSGGTMTMGRGAPDSAQVDPLIRSALFDISEAKETARQKAALEEQLRQAHKMEALGRLAGGIAHDFNNLLTLIIGYSKLALNNMSEGDAFYVHVAQINKAGNHAAELIDQLLAFSRNQNVAPDHVDLNALIEDMSSMIARITGDDIELSLELSAHLGTIHVDATQLKQVLLNLVVNAREAMPAGGELVLRTRNAELHYAAAQAREIAAGSYVLLEVQDNGCGMDEATRARIFEPFFTTKHGNKGHGFGLATTYGIIAQSGGHIEVLSEIDRGTTFLIYLPRVDEPPSPIEYHELGAEPSVELETVLLVDDSTDLSSYAAMALGQYEYEVLRADTPTQALTLCENRAMPIDLLITDVTMPGMGGRELFERVRKLHPSIRVIYMSGHAHDVVCSERGIEEEAPFLVKPFTPEAIAHLVRKVLDS